MSSTSRRYGRSSSVTAAMLAGPRCESVRSGTRASARFDDVLDDQDVAPAIGRSRSLSSLTPPRPAVGVARELDHVDRVKDRQRPREVGEEDGARLQGRDEQRLAALVVGGDLGAELGDARGDLGGARDTTSPTGSVSYEASFSRYRWARRSRSRR